MKLIRTMIPIINVLPRKLKNRFYLLLFLTVISTVFEILVLSLLYPFIDSFLDSSGASTETNFLLDFTGVSFDNIPIFLGFIIVIGAFLKITYVIYESRLAHKIGHILGEKIFVIDSSKFQNGIYYLSITTSFQKILRKIIVDN